MVMSCCLPPRWPQYTPSWFIKFLLSLYLSAFWRPYLCCSACETSGWFTQTKTEPSAALAALPEYCITYTLCSYLCPCRGLILDSLYVVSKKRAYFLPLTKASEILRSQKCTFPPVFLAEQPYLSRHWLWKFRQGIMCEWEHDSVAGKNRQIPGVSKAESQTRRQKDLRTQ